MIFICNNAIYETTEWRLRKNQLLIDDELISLNVCSEKDGYINYEEFICNQLKGHSSYIDLRKIKAIDEEVTK